MSARDELAAEMAGWTVTSGYYGQSLGYKVALEIAEHLVELGYGKLEDAKSAALREAALELMNVNEHESRMPGIRFAVGFLAGQRRPE